MKKYDNIVVEKKANFVFLVSFVLCMKHIRLCYGKKVKRLQHLAGKEKSMENERSVAFNKVAYNSMFLLIDTYASASWILETGDSYFTRTV